jgi:hypothetical protein
VRAPSVEFTYPDEATESVPPDAIFWVVSPGGRARAWIDSVPLAPRGPGLIEQHQFSYPGPLAEGEHELVARAGDDDSERRAITFRVAAGAPSTGDGRIDAVDLYPLAQGPSGWLEPPGYDAACEQRATPLGDYCNDTLDWDYARIRFSGEGNVVAYVVQGGWLAPAGCTTLFTTARTTDPSQYSIAAVLPTGLAEARTYTGEVEWHDAEEAYPELYSQPSACSLGLGQRAPSALGSVGLAFVAWLARRRRATR